jgi:hypothetical protein
MTDLVAEATDRVKRLSEGTEEDADRGGVETSPSCEVDNSIHEEDSLRSSGTQMTLLVRPAEGRTGHEGVEMDNLQRSSLESLLVSDWI